MKRIEASVHVITHEGVLCAPVTVGVEEHLPDEIAFELQADLREMPLIRNDEVFLISTSVTICEA